MIGSFLYAGKFLEQRGVIGVSPSGEPSLGHAECDIYIFGNQRLHIGIRMGTVKLRDVVALLW